MDKLAKLALLGESAKYDVCASSSATREMPRYIAGAYWSVSPLGKP